MPQQQQQQQQQKKKNASKTTQSTETEGAVVGDQTDDVEFRTYTVPIAKMKRERLSHEELTIVKLSLLESTISSPYLARLRDELLNKMRGEYFMVLYRGKSARLRVRNKSSSKDRAVNPTKSESSPNLPFPAKN